MAQLGYLVRKILRQHKQDFRSSPEYWDLRYKLKGNSGAGSYGRLAQFKAEVINAFLAEHNIPTVIEFGCGDGNQLSLANYANYTGVDVSQTVIKACKARFKQDTSKQFLHTSQYNGETAELALSLDVIYHLIEDDIFARYMTDLFNASERYVIIYSSNYSATVDDVDHVRHRHFTEWVSEHVPEFRLIREIPNKYPYSELSPDTTSFADFFIYQRI